MDSPNYGSMKIGAIALLTGALLGVPQRADAQGFPFSQRGGVSQTVAFTNIEVTYGRPVARGRALFGKLVPWDSVWCPGADSATLLTLDHDIVLQGHALKAGEYSLWLVPREHARWTLIFNSAAHVFHKPYVGAATEVLRVDVTPQALSHMETLAIYFPVVLRDEADLRIHWGETGVSVHLKAPFRPLGP